MGGSYVFSTNRGPLSTSQTPGTIENKNRGVLNATNCQPEKFANADNESSFSAGRKQYINFTQNGSVVPLTGTFNDKYIAPMSSSMQLNVRKNTEMGRGTMTTYPQLLTYKSYDQNVVSSAMRRVRGGGYVCPPKIGALENSYIGVSPLRRLYPEHVPPPAPGTTIVDSTVPVRTSLRDPSVKYSSFMPAHLRKRINCSDSECVAPPLPPSPPPVVLPEAPNIYYHMTSFVFTGGGSVSIPAPVTTAGMYTHMTVSPNLPAGISINSSTGAIVGTAMNVTPVNSYTITASNIYGSSTFVMDIEVLPYVFTYASLKTAISLWFDDNVAALVKYGPIGNWNVAYVTSMAILFDNRSSFNEDISQWDTGSVTDMQGMFRGAFAFNQPIGSWDVSRVTSMFAMFDNATSFNQEIGDWDVRSVMDMGNMFAQATNFNQHIDEWVTSSLTNISYMFDNAIAFNHPIGNWNVSLVTEAQYMFKNATEFNMEIGCWIWNESTSYPAPQINLEGMFYNAKAFNREIRGWNVRYNMAMTNMFYGATAFENAYGGVVGYSVQNINVYFWTPSIQYSPIEYTFLYGDETVNIAPPSNTGAPFDTIRVTGGMNGDNYGISFPTGLMMRADGSIHGTATPLTVESPTFTIEAVNGTQRSTTTITITILPNTTVPMISYTSSTAVSFQVGVANTISAPTNTGGTIDSFIVFPDLPTGLILDTISGEITGTPSSGTDLTHGAGIYTIRAINSAGTSDITIGILVTLPTPVNNEPATSLETDTAEAVLVDASFTEFLTANNIDTVDDITSVLVASDTNTDGMLYDGTITIPSGDFSLLTDADKLELIAIIQQIYADQLGQPAESFLVLLVSGSIMVRVQVYETELRATNARAKANTAAINAATAFADADAAADAAEGFATTALNAATQAEASAAASSADEERVKANVAATNANAYANEAAMFTTASGAEAALSAANAESSSGRAAAAAASAAAAAAATVDAESPVIAYAQQNYTFEVGASVTISSPGNTGAEFDSVSVSPDLPSGLVLNTDTGAITGTPDTGQSSETYTITATSSAGVTGTTTITITNTDTTPPVITSGATGTDLVENSGAGELVYTITATDTGGGVSSYAIGGTDVALLSVNSSTGDVTLNANPDYETKPNYSFTVTASDAAGNTSAATAVTFSITGVTVPVITSGATGTDLAENSGAGQPVYTITASDAVAVTSFAIAGTDAGLLSVNSSTGDVTLTADPDYETKSSYSFTVTASDAAGNTSAATAVTFSITDVDDSPPVIVYAQQNYILEVEEYATIPSPGNTGAEFVSVSVSPDLPSGLVLNTDTGAITGTPDTGQSSETYTITATSSAGVTGTTTITITNTDTTPPVITSGATGTDLVENSGAGQPVYTITASDAQGATSFAIAGTDAGLLSVDIASGNVTLNANPDYGTKPSYSFTVTASDAAGNTSVATAVTFSITGVDDTAPVITSIQTGLDLQNNSGAGQLVYTITASDAQGATSFAIGGTDAGLLSVNSSTGNVTLTADPDYEAKSSYSFTVTASDAAGNTSDATTVTFSINMFTVLTDSTINQVVDDWITDPTDSMFTVTTTIPYYDHISNWDTSHVTTMKKLFNGSTYNGGKAIRKTFDEDISQWNVSNVTDMESMFQSTAFNQDISGWNVSNVTNMRLMFASASVFNQPIGDWDVSKVTAMDWMFSSATAFDQPIGEWNVSNVTNMSYMFRIADAFNQDISGWDVSKVTNMSSMFNLAKSFNQPIGGWDVSEVTNMSGMFSESEMFNQDISGWDTSKVTVMRAMFWGAEAFNKPIGGWNVSEVTDMKGMFYNNPTFNQPIGDWDVSKVTNMEIMFQRATAFDQYIREWNIDNTTYPNIFDDMFDIDGPFYATYVGTDGFGTTPTSTFFNIDLASNNNAPIITSGEIGTNIESNSGAGQTVYTITASDAVVATSFAIVYGDAGLLSVNSSNGEVILIADPDYETKSSYSFAVTASDALGNTSAAFTVTFSIFDPNAPIVTLSSDGTEIRWAYNPGNNDPVNYDFGNKNITVEAPSGYKIILQTVTPEGSIQGAYDTRLSNIVNLHDYILTLPSVDGAGYGDLYYQRKSNLSNDSPDGNWWHWVLNFNVYCIAIPPVITSGATGTDLVENSGAGQIVYTITTTSDTVVAPSFAIAGTDAGLLSVNSSNGEVSLTADPDYETKSSYSFTVTASAGANSTSDAVDVTFSITDVMDIDVSITSGATGTTLVENTEAGQLVYTITATTTSNTTPVTSFAIAGTDAGLLSVNSSTGAVTLTAVPVYGTKSSYSFTVTASDDAGNTSAATAVTFSIDGAITLPSDSSDVKWAYNSGSSVPTQYVFNNDKNIAIEAPNGYQIILKSTNPYYSTSRTYATQLGSIDNLHDHILTLPHSGYGYGGLSYLSSSGGNWWHNTIDFYVYAGVATPVITSGATGTTLAENTVAGQLVYTITVSDLVAATSFAIGGTDADLLSVDSTTGEVTLNAAPDYGTKPAYSFTVTASDDGGNTGPATAVTFSITGVDDNAPIITSRQTGIDLQDNSGPGQLVYTITASDALGVTSFAIGGTDAGLLSVNSSTGNVTLTADPDYEAKSSYSFTVTASDAAGNTSDATTVTFSINMFTVLTDSTINQVVNNWISNPTNSMFTDTATIPYYGHISTWNVSNVTNMDSLFYNKDSFNDDISGWNVSGVTNMYRMFQSTSFNQPIGGWNVSNVTDMRYMFYSTSFNQPIGGWNVSNVTNMEGMFRYNHVFNQPIGAWNVSNVTNMKELFYEANAFNQPIGNWDVSKVTTMQRMFYGYMTSMFNHPIGDWDVSKVADMSHMFAFATAFNQDINGWNVSNVTNMSGMFWIASAFNKPIGDWDVSKVTDMGYMFYAATAFNQDISGWDVSNVTDMGNMFQQAYDFDQNIRGWTNDNVANYPNIFKDMFSLDSAFYTTYNGTVGFGTTPTSAFFNQSSV